MGKKIIRKDSISDEREIIKTKVALKRLGYYQMPSYGITAYADKNMFKAIADFQKDKGFKDTGEIKDGDDTSLALNEALTDIIGPEDEDPDVKSPIFHCVSCGAPHGGSHGDMCSDCASKA